MNNYRYYEDTYGNQYRWTIKPEEDGKYHARILKAKVRNSWMSFTKTKDVSFKLRRKAKAWCLSHVRDAKLHQDSVLRRREVRRVIRLNAKPTFTKSELKMKKLEADIVRANELQQKWIKKAKFVSNMVKKYDKNVERLKKKHLKLVEVAIVQ